MVISRFFKSLSHIDWLSFRAEAIQTMSFVTFATLLRRHLNETSDERQGDDTKGDAKQQQQQQEVQADTTQPVDPMLSK